ncbi:Rv3654c family TadE-like protein [Flexivirga caeni]|uniref:Putative Flp pilus-assembly TadG-like N-terminal domain-containing protein n=1 Tax=Flexivirga caeni TaxID=2294115 RepID=A0A3M9LYF6_9MICO|nr:Rv3654c family TadE-like protein [Flexivirga caeni]RNI18311.1 hypothetical protein EFY87_18110 [Flexivirga caeni]
MRSRERGSSTVLVVAGIGVVLVLLTGALALVSAVAASHRARAAADLAALAAARVVVDGSDARHPCAVAAQVAGRNHAVVTSCAVAGEDVTVTVAAAVSWPGLGPARAQARAGP